MSPRRNRRRDDIPAIDEDRARRGGPAPLTDREGEWMVRTVPAGSSAKAYRCPGCDQEIRPGTGHVVAWPADERGDLSDRRHWHTGCWRARGRRAPVVRRGRPHRW